MTANFMADLNANHTLHTTPAVWLDVCRDCCEREVGAK